MIDDLERKIADTASLNSKLILLIGPPRSGKTALVSFRIALCSGFEWGLAWVGPLARENAPSPAGVGAVQVSS